MNATELEKSRLCLLNDNFKRLTALPINVDDRHVKKSGPNSVFNDLTRIIQDLSVLSLDSSIMSENRFDVLLQTLLRWRVTFCACKIMEIHNLLKFI